ncbi:MAG: GGDEF domain-containing protein [Acidovorax sp.]|nr:GGDEF domain-containing protein [Acidovorax sp.]
MHAAPFPPAPPAPSPPGSRLAHKAFWVMARRVTVMAACVDLAFLALFLWFDAPLLAWLNLGSIALYAAAYALLARRINLLALVLIWTEVLGHATLGTLLIGWDSGFHYYLLMFIPATIVSGGHRTRPFVLVVLLFLFYMGLHTAARATGTLAPLSATGLWVVHAFNVAVVFAMAAYTARYYYGTVRRAEHQLVALASTDPLTGLSNRRNLIDRAEQALQQPRHAGQPTALVIADIDHFKHINDAHGHEAGDRTIVHVATLLARCCRAQDIAARWGGEEFLVLLPATDTGAATLVAERIRAAVAAQPLAHGSAAIAVTLSLGVAEVAHHEPLGPAIARADHALYRSKEDGRNRVTVAGRA